MTIKEGKHLLSSLRIAFLHAWQLITFHEWEAVHVIGGQMQAPGLHSIGKARSARIRIKFHDWVWIFYATPSALAMNAPFACLMDCEWMSEETWQYSAWWLAEG